MRCLVLVALLAAAATAQASDFYKWKDDDGVWHYDSKAPKDRPSVPIRVATGTGNAGTGMDDATAAASDKPAIDPNANDPASQAARARAASTTNENCKRATNNVSIYENNAQVSLPGADGSPHVLSPEEHLAKLKEARDQRDAFCAKK